MGTDLSAVPRGARALAVLALAVCLPPLIWWVVAGGTWDDASLVLVTRGPVALFASSTLVPVMCRRREAFRLACLVTALLILVGSVLFAFFGVFLLLPAAPVLLAARGLARMGTRGRLASASGWSFGLISLVAGLTLLTKLLVLPFFGPPDEYDAVLSQDSPLLAREGTSRALSSSDLGPGVETTTIDFVGGGLPRVIVILSPSSSATERARVRERLATLPGVLQIHDCKQTLNDC